MTLPLIWPHIRVSGQFLRLDGSANIGSIWFETGQTLETRNNVGRVTMDDPYYTWDNEWPLNSANSLSDGPVIRVLPLRQAALLDDNGEFSILLPCTDAGGTPVGWTYQVNEKIDDGRAQYSIELSHIYVGTGVNLITHPHVAEVAAVT